MRMATFRIMRMRCLQKNMMTSFSYAYKSQERIFVNCYKNPLKYLVKENIAFDQDIFFEMKMTLQLSFDPCMYFFAIARYDILNFGRDNVLYSYTAQSGEEQVRVKNNHLRVSTSILVLHK